MINPHNGAEIHGVVSIAAGIAIDVVVKEDGSPPPRPQIMSHEQLETKGPSSPKGTTGECKHHSIATLYDLLWPIERESQHTHTHTQTQFQYGK